MSDENDMQKKAQDAYFGGILPNIAAGNFITYDPSKGITLQDMEEFFKSFSKPRAPRQYQIVTDTIGADLMSFDPKRVADAKRRMRVLKITAYRLLIQNYGSELAKVIAILDRNMGGNHRLKNHWFKYLYHTSYKGIDSGREDSYIRIIVDLDKITNLFSIEMEAGYDYGMDYEVKYRDLLSKGITHKSILNQINYFINKYKQ